jgi:hypothetical protein
MTIRTDGPGTSRVSVETSAGRATPETPDHAFRGMLEDGASALLSGVESATSVLPGGAAISAVIRGAVSGGGEGGLGGGVDAEGGSTAQTLQDALARQADTQMQYIQLQQQMQDENRRYTTLSNVLKARHETAKTAIGNIR